MYMKNLYPGDLIILRRTILQHLRYRYRNQFLVNSPIFSQASRFSSSLFKSEGPQSTLTILHNDAIIPARIIFNCGITEVPTTITFRVSYPIMFAFFRLARLAVEIVTSQAVGNLSGCKQLHGIL